MRGNFLMGLLGAACLAACGGSTLGGGGGGSTPPTGANVQPVVVDAGPASTAGTLPTINILYTTVTICAPGSTSNCQTIDHIQVDTGSSGFRIIGGAVGSNGNGGSGFNLSLPAVTDSGGNAIAECLPFVDGSSWGTLRTADIKIGGETAAGVTIQVIGDGTYPVPANTCTGTQENTVATFGANGILGIGPFVSDCGAACAQSVSSSTYYSCASNNICSQTLMAEASQVSNPVASFPVDNNGVIIELPAVSYPGVASLNGSLVFGIGTQTNNALGSARVLAVDPVMGTLTTTYKGTPLSQSVIDSGSNGYFFQDSSIAVCSGDNPFYCPGSTLSLSGTIQSAVGSPSVTVNFNVARADNIPATTSAAPDLAGPASVSNPPTGTYNANETFDWGLPFYFGRNVYTAIESRPAGTATGPYFAF